MMRGLGLGNGAGRAVITFIGACTAAGAFILMMASPVLLFLVTYLATGSGMAGFVALFLGIHGLIFWIAMRSSRPSPFGLVGEGLAAVRDGLFNPPVFSDDEMLEAMLGATS